MFLRLITAYTGSKFEMRKEFALLFPVLNKTEKLKHKPCYTLTISKDINYTRKRLGTKECLQIPGVMASGQ